MSRTEERNRLLHATENTTIQQQRYGSHHSSPDDGKESVEELRISSTSPIGITSPTKLAGTCSRAKTSNASQYETGAFAVTIDQDVFDEPSHCYRLVGVVLEQLEPISAWMNLFYNVVFANALILVIFFLAMKIFNPTIFAGVPKIAPMADWLLIGANLTIMTSYSCRSFLRLRICLTAGCSLFMLWGLISSDQFMIDVVTFNAVMVLLNVRHAILLLYERRYIAFSSEYEQVYQHVFAPYLKRTEFAQLIEKSFIRDMSQGEIFKQQGDLVTSLCILISGHITVYRRRNNPKTARKTQRRRVKKQNDSGQLATSERSSPSSRSDSAPPPPPDLGRVINECYPNSFIEAPQWVNAKLNPENYRYEVTFQATEDIRYIKWPRETLVSLFKEHPHLKISVQAVLGLQTAEMLLRSIQKRRGEEGVDVHG